MAAGTWFWIIFVLDHLHQLSWPFRFPGMGRRLAPGVRAAVPTRLPSVRQPYQLMR
jgi:hypothetical protein